MLNRILIAVLLIIAILCSFEDISIGEVKLNPRLELNTSHPEVEFDVTTGNYIIHYTNFYGVRKFLIFEPANKVTVFISVGIEFDSTDQSYRYSYKVKSDKSSEQDVSAFYLEFGDTLTNITTPPHWWSWFSFWRKRTINYSVAETGGIPSNWEDQGNIPPSIFDIEPGDSLLGFSYTSKGLPRIVECYAEGFTDLPKIDDDPEAIPDSIGRMLPKIFGDWVMSQNC